LKEPLQSGTKVRVQRAQPVNLSADGLIGQYRTHANTVGEFLAEVGVEIHPADEIWLGDQMVAANTPLPNVLRPPNLGSVRNVLRPGAQGELPVPPQVSLRRAASLTLMDDGLAKTLYTTDATVGQVLQENEVQLYLGDQVNPRLQEPITPNMVITIDRSVPVEIIVDGRQLLTRTRAGSVASVLGQEGVALVGADRVEPDLNAAVQEGMTIQVTRVREEYLVESDPIPFETVWVADPEVEIDSVRLAQEGQVGLTKRRYRVVYEDGVEVDRVLEDVWAAQPPITKTMAYGTKIVIRTLETPEGPIDYWRKMRVYTTSYKPASCGKPPDHPRYGYTRLGWKLKKGIVAVDPDVIPLKTEMYVPGYGLARAGDTGGGVKGKFVDLGYSDDDFEGWWWWSDIYLLAPAPPANKIRWVLPDWPKYPDRRRN
jgi:uncharacterized protein YabE (DUF348 family)